MSSSLSDSLALFVRQLECSLCKEILSNPYTLQECGHTFCRSCLVEAMHLKCLCPECRQPVLVKKMRKNASFATMLACVKKMISSVDSAVLKYSSTCRKTTPNKGVNGRKAPKTPATEIENLQIGSTPPSIMMERRGTGRPKKLQSQDSKKSTNVAVPKEETPSRNTPLKRSKKSPTAPTSNSKKNRSTSNNASSVSSKKPSLFFLTTGLSHQQREIIASSYDKIGKERVVLLSNYSSEITHIISGCNEKSLCPRTVKYLKGILEGKHIVSYDWFLESLSQGMFVEESSYWIKGDDIVGIVTEAVHKSINRPKGTLLFDGLAFYLAGSFKSPSPTRSDLQSLITTGGGKFYSRKPKSSTTEGEDLWIIYDPVDIASGTGLSWISSFSQTTTWAQFLECISYYSTKYLSSS